MTLTAEQWKEILSAVNLNEDNRLEAIKEKLNERDGSTYQKWAQEGFGITHLFNVSFNMPGNRSTQRCTLLHIAALNGHLAIVKYLVDEKHADVNQANNYGSTALSLAVENGQLDIVKYLIDEKHANVNQAKALNSAASNGHLAIVKYLIDEKHADVNQTNDSGSTALNAAAFGGHLAIVKYLVDEKRADVNKVDNSGSTALNAAVFIGHLAIVKYLVDGRHADVNKVDNHGSTALHVAAFGHLAIVKYLVDGRHVDVNKANNYGSTALSSAVAGGCEDIVEFLIQKTLIQDFSIQKPDYLTDEFSTYWDKCKNKIEGKIGNSNTSYLDLLKADEDKIATHMINDEIKKTINEFTYKGEFSILESQIRNKFNKGVERRDLIDDGKRVIQRFDCGRNIKLNSEVSEKIAFYLPNSDLKNLKDIGDNKKNAHVKPSTKMDETREEQGIAENGYSIRQAFLHS